MNASPKRMLFVLRRAPYGTIYGQEALDVLLVGAAFAQDASVAFLDDGVFQLRRDQRPSASGMKHYSKTFGALDDFGVGEALVEAESLISRGMAESDLIEILREDGSSMIRLISSEELSEFMERQDVILQF